MTPAEREALILSLKPKVEYLARRRYFTLNRVVAFEELESAAWLGAILAVDRYDPERGNLLATYAEWRIRGEMEDYLRSLDSLSRDHRRVVASGQQTLNDPRASEEEKQLARELLKEAPVVFSISRAPDNGPATYEPLNFTDPRAIAEHKRREARLTLVPIYRRARLRLRNAKVLRRWMEGESLKAIGKSMGFSESRASVICSEAIRKLRAAA